MKLAVSNIAWTPAEEPEVAAVLQKLGVRFIEIAPTKKWDDPTTQANDDEIEAYKKFWRSYDIEVVAFQSMLFNRPDLKLFKDEALRVETQQYLDSFIRLAGKFGAGAMVFGSPKNRQRGELGVADAQSVAIPFFRALGETAQQHNTVFCIEPNAPQYACDFVTNAQQGIDIVSAVNHPGFGLHLDIACMTLAGDNIEKSISDAAPYLKHFHISSPMLQDVGPDTDVPHEAAAKALKSINYQGFVSIEMRPAEAGTNVARVEQAVTFAQATYGV
jgi:D-psicose/D-tagatose/L-ribulose 3-epimerase